MALAAICAAYEYQRLIPAQLVYLRHMSACCFELAFQELHASCPWSVSASWRLAQPAGSRRPHRRVFTTHRARQVLLRAPCRHTTVEALLDRAWPYPGAGPYTVVRRGPARGRYHPSRSAW